MISDPWFYLVAVPAILITGASKSGFGTGLGILGVPMIALTVPINQATGIMLPILMAMDAFGLWVYRRQWDGRNLAYLLPGALLGIVVGTLTFRLTDERAIRFLVGTIAIVFTLAHWWGGRNAPARRPGRLRGALWGTVAGFTSFVAHSGGTPLSVYLLPQRLDKTVFVGTTVVFFALVNAAKVPPYAWLGQLAPGNLATSLVLMPLAPLGIALGVLLHRRVAPGLFYRICYAMVFLAGLKLLSDSLGLGAWLRAL